MREWVVSFLCCPVTQQDLQLVSFEEDNQGEIISGLLKSMDGKCLYPIIQGVPRFVSPTLYSGQEFLNQFREELDKEGFASQELKAQYAGLKANTNKYFGWEWQEFKRWGWQEKVPEITEKTDGSHHAGTFEKSKEAFFSKGMFSKGELKDKVIFDGGCGNGRFSYQAYLEGAKVLGIDLGEGSVLAAQENCLEFPEIQVVQGDLHNPPFKIQSLDAGFSIGVLMHTGNAALAFQKLSETVKAGGTFTAHVYSKGNWIVELNDWLLRKFTKLLPMGGKIAFSKYMAWWSRVLSRIRVKRRDMRWVMNHFVELRNTYHQMFDWWTAPIATHHTYPEVHGWTKKAGMEVVDDRDKGKPTNFLSKHFKVIGVVTVKAGRPK